MPDVYIFRSGMESKALKGQFAQTELATVKGELVQMDQEGKIKDDRLRQMELTVGELRRVLDELQKDFEGLIEALSSNASIFETQMALTRRHSALNW